MAISKIILNGVTQMDVTGTTANASRVLNTYKATGADGVEFTGQYVPASPSLQAKTNINPTTSSQTITADNGYDGLSSVQINAMPSGTAGTPSASKGTVSNHSISVTPSVTNTTGYITGGTKTGTAVTVSASELVSGSETKTTNGTYDVTNLASLVVNVSGGGSSGVQVATTTTTLSSASGYIQFEDLLGAPTSYFVMAMSELTTATTAKSASVVGDGTNTFGQTITNTSNAQVSYASGTYSSSYNNGVLTVYASGADFQAIEYVLVYSYGGTSANIGTEDVQVGSGATSITFTGLEEEPAYFSCVFKSNFSTSSGYQRTICVVYDGTDIYGLEMDSSAKYATHWSYSYNNGSLTITSNGTNQGGYFHQPGYYQLTYAYGTDGNYQTKSVTYTPTTSQQTDTITADSQYDALKKVNVTVNAMPTMTLPSSTSATSSGTSKATITPTSSTQYLNIPTGYNSTAQYYTISASGGGGGSISVATTTWSNSSNTATSHQFTGLSGTPKFAVLRCTTQLTRSSSNTYYYIADIVWDGTNAYGNYHLRSNGSFNNVASNATTKFTVTTGTNSITFTSGGSRSGAPGSFYNGTYELVYIY